MALSVQDRELIESFLNYAAGAVAGDERYGDASRHDRDDETVMAVRLAVGSACWLEVAVHPAKPEVRVGFITNDRWRNEALEQAIEESGDTMSEFVEVGLAEAGVNWDDPPVEHYREDEEFFYFATPVEIDEVVDIDFTDFRGKIVRMMEGYFVAFGAVVVSEDEDEDEDE